MDRSVISHYWLDPAVKAQIITLRRAVPELSELRIVPSPLGNPGAWT